MTESTPQPTPNWQLITTRQEYRQALAALVDSAQLRLRVFDADARELELQGLEMYERLASFLLRSRDSRIAIILHSVDYLTRNGARFHELMRRFGGQITVYRTEGEATRAHDCFVIADDMHVVRRAVQAQARGAYLRDDPQEVQRMIERFDQILESSPLALSATTLGL